MPKSIQLQNTEGIILDTGEMAAISANAIREANETRKQQVTMKRWLEAQTASNRIVSYIFSRILQKAEPWKARYDAEFEQNSPLRKK